MRGKLAPTGIAVGAQTSYRIDAPWRFGTKRQICLSYTPQGRLARRAAHLRSTKISRESYAAWRFGAKRQKEKDPVVGSTGSSNQFGTIDQAVCVVACLVTLSA
jgi:hypothetical protein